MEGGGGAKLRQPKVGKSAIITLLRELAKLHENPIPLFHVVDGPKTDAKQSTSCRTSLLCPFSVRESEPWAPIFVACMANEQEGKYYPTFSL